MGSGLHEVDFRALSIIDGGKLNAALGKLLSRASLDCQDRPGDISPREVDIKIKFRPVMLQDGDCSDTKMDVKITGKIPAHQSKEYSVGFRRKGDGGMFVINENSLDNVNQNTMGFDGDDE